MQRPHTRYEPAHMAESCGQAHSHEGFGRLACLAARHFCRRVSPNGNFLGLGQARSLKGDVFAFWLGILGDLTTHASRPSALPQGTLPTCNDHSMQSSVAAPPGKEWKDLAQSAPIDETAGWWRFMPTPELSGTHAHCLPAGTAPPGSPNGAASPSSYAHRPHGSRPPGPRLPLVSPDHIHLLLRRVA
jgi:hypothetical protein